MRWLAVFLLMCACTSQTPQDKPQDQVCFEEHCFEVEVARTDYEHALGLSYRTHLDLDKGMLFVFSEPGLYQFWMKNTYIGLDIIWIGSSGNVVYIERQTQPCGSEFCPTIDPGRIAKYVLEVNGGAAEQIGLEVGDSVQILLVEDA